MNLFQLDPASIAARVPAERCPSFGASVWRGMWGLTALSIAGFAPWPILDRWFAWMGETGLYLTCTVVFIGLSGVFLHRLVLGEGSMKRFYVVFTAAFLGYAVTWVSVWMGLRDNVGENSALVAGMVVMAVILTWAFAAWAQFPAVAAALLIGNGAGYYAGRWVEGQLAVEHRLLAITLWALCFGMGFGAGLGAAFYFCQTQARRIIRGRRRDVVS